MTQEVTIYQSIDETMSLGKLLAQSGYFADSRDAAQAVVKVLAGRELGFGPIASMTGINIIKGKVTLSANLIAAAIKRSGRYNYRVKTLTDEECSIVFYDGSQEIGVSTFTMEDAKAAALATGDNWRKFKRNMLFARAISNGAKWYCPDLSGGPLYTPDELGAQVDGETGEIINAPAPRIVVEQPKPQPTNGQVKRIPDGDITTPTGRVFIAAEDREPANDPPGFETWADWRHQGDAIAWAMTQGKFNHQKHAENAYAKTKEAAKPTRASEMWQAWYEVVMTHAPAKAQPAVAEPLAADTDGWAEIEANGVEVPLFS